MKDIGYAKVFDGNGRVLHNSDLLPTIRVTTVADLTKDDLDFSRMWVGSRLVIKPQPGDGFTITGWPHFLIDFKERNFYTMDDLYLKVAIRLRDIKRTLDILILDVGL